jgi:hypothetical protein
MAKILVAGGRLESQEMSSEMQEFCHEVGRQIILQKHVLLTGCFNSLDRVVAEGSMSELESNPDLDPRKFVKSWVLAGRQPSHRIGQIQKSKLKSWDPGEDAVVLPEPILQADAVILIGGRRGTFRTANLARFAGKPLLPVATFGGAAEMVFDSEIDGLPASGQGRAKRDEMGILNTFAPADIGAFARDIVTLTGRMATGTSTFVVMSFREESDDTYSTIDRICKAFGYQANRTDKTNDTGRIFSKIVEGIREAAFVVADVTYESLNVYFELGYAEALGKPVIVIAKEGTDLPFDTNDLPTIFWRDQTRLYEALQNKFESLTGRSLANHDSP